MTPFAAFKPDASSLDPTASDTIINVVPHEQSYGPFPSLQSITGALPGQPYGAFLAKDDSGTYNTFAATQTKLYKLNTATLAWDDVSKTATTYTTPVDQRWTFDQFGSRVVVTNYNEPVQSYVLGSSAKFVDLSASAPRARTLTTAGDFLVLGQTTDSIRQIQWSGLNSEAFWTAGQQSSDFQVFPDGGRVQALVGFERGIVIFQEDTVREAARDATYIFTFQNTVHDHGCVAPRSVVNAGAGGIFYLSKDGFYQYGAPPIPIGDEAVDDFFTALADPAYIYNVQGTVDPIRKVVYWRFKSTAHVNEKTTDCVLAYHYNLKRWSYLEVELSWLLQAVSSGYTLDGLGALGYNLDNLPYSLDSQAWQGGQPLIAGFDAQFKLATFAGSPMQATIQTTDAELNPGLRSYVSGFRPVSDAPVVNGRVAGKDTYGGFRTWGGQAPMNVTGLVPARRSARLHRFEIVIPAGTAWKHAHGVTPDARSEGRR